MKTPRTECAGNTVAADGAPEDRRTLGRRGEEAAARYLTARGYAVLERGFRMFRGEIDIIAAQGETLVFCEVRTRTRDDFGLPGESVTRAKQSQVRKVARGYLLRRGLVEDRTACRFDVLALRSLSGDRFEVAHFENAF